MAQAALKLVLEPIFEADFQPCSHDPPPGEARPKAATAPRRRPNYNRQRRHFTLGQLFPADYEAR